jgi:hypothetical protein
MKSIILIALLLTVAFAATNKHCVLKSKTTAPYCCDLGDCLTTSDRDLNAVTKWCEEDFKCEGFKYPNPKDHA